MNYEKTRLDRNRTKRRMKLAHYEGRGLYMETGLNFLFFKICGRNRAAGATNSDLEDQSLKYNVKSLMSFNCHFLLLYMMRIYGPQ